MVMIENPDEKSGNAKENSTQADRRAFIKGAAASMLGAVAISGAAAQPADAAPQMADSEDPKIPAGLKRPAMLSSKYTVSYEKSVPAAMGVMTEYFAALSRRDQKG